MIALGVVFWCTGFFSSINSEDYKTLAIFSFVSSVLFASPHMIIASQKDAKKSKLETYTELAVSGFYTAALLFVLFNAMPYFDAAASASSLQVVGQTMLVISFAWTLCLHSWSTLSNFMGVLKLTES
jgi:hypothetical protein